MGPVLPGGAAGNRLAGRIEGGQMLDNYADLWEALADHLGGRDAVVHGDRVRSWAEIEDRASRLAGAFSELGVVAGSTVAIDLWNCSENVEVLFAAFKLRATPFNINYRYRERELTHLLGNARPKVIVFDTALADRVIASVAAVDFPVAAVEVRAEHSAPGALRFEDLLAGHDPAPRIERDGEDEFIIYTGGTTGYPKGVVWAHRAGRLMPAPGGRRPENPSDYAAAVAASGPPSTALVIAPLMHASGLLRTLRALATGGRVLFCSSRSLDADEILSLVQRHRVQTFSVIGDAIARPILEALDRARDQGHPYDLSSVESVGNTGGIWSAEVKRGFLAHGDFTIIDGLSATEGGGFAIAEARDTDQIETAKFKLGPNSRVLTEDGRDVVPGSGEIGVLATAGALPKGYLNDPERTAKAWPTIGGVRYSAPGDLARVEADGSVTLLGRGSEVVNTGGEKVFVEEVETAILTHPAVRDALVVGLPDPRWGHRVTAVVSLKNGAELSDRALIDHVGEQIANYKRPKQVVFVTEIPRSPTGKADRPAAKRLAVETTPIAST
jgi:acyl-CoA synthetase (AMP-forming)/AMP-acid ligase II